MNFLEWSTSYGVLFFGTALLILLLGYIIFCCILICDKEEEMKKRAEEIDVDADGDKDGISKERLRALIKRASDKETAMALCRLYFLKYHKHPYDDDFD